MELVFSPYKIISVAQENKCGVWSGSALYGIISTIFLKDYLNQVAWHY